MEVIIRTQDRKFLGLFENFFEVAHDGRKYNLGGMSRNGKMMILGQFNNKETAIKELDMIQSEISYYIKFKNEKIPIVEINEDYKVE